MPMALTVVFQELSGARKLSRRILPQSTNRKSEGKGKSSEFGPVLPWNHTVGAIQKLATISHWRGSAQFLAGKCALGHVWACPA